jgi:hypothetical protein
MARIGYHGTSRRHRTSLSGGLRQVASEWDPGSGGELGQGFYVANNVEAARLYGLGSCQAGGAGPLRGDNAFVDVWEVSLPDGVGLADLTHMPVQINETWGQFPRQLSDNYYFVYLCNDPGVAPTTLVGPASAQQVGQISQVKFNPNFLGILSIQFHSSVSVNDV